ncbi:peptidoglycan DD-metalloendopeptidase family protein [Chloroflexota bacterium]
MTFFESLRNWARRVMRQISGVALSHPPEPTDSLSLPRNPVATGPLPAQPNFAPDTLAASIKPPAPQPPVQSGPSPTIQPISQPDDLPCIATIRPDLGTLNIRSGPGLTFPRLERAAGGMRLGMAGVSGPDEEGFPWYWLTWENGSGWVRSDLVTTDVPGALAEDCAALTNAPLSDNGPLSGNGLSLVEPPADFGSREPGRRWPLPVAGRIAQGFHNTHRAYDLAALPGTPICAGGPGVIIRHMDCPNCQDDPGGISPGLLTSAQRQTLFADPDWGFGYGNTLVVRHEYADLPEPLQAAMAAQDLSDGYAYVQYAHLASLSVSAGTTVTAETVLGSTGATGCCAGPTLHLAVKIGRAETVDDCWSELPAVHPGLLFFVELSAE